MAASCASLSNQRHIVFFGIMLVYFSLYVEIMTRNAEHVFADRLGRCWNFSGGFSLEVKLSYVVLDKYSKSVYITKEDFD